MPGAAWEVAEGWRCLCLLVWRRGAATAEATASAPEMTEGSLSQPRRGNGAYLPPERSSRTASAVLMPQDTQRRGEKRAADSMDEALSLVLRPGAHAGPQLFIWSTLQGAQCLVNTAAERSCA